MNFSRRGVAVLALTCFLALVPAGLSLAKNDKPEADTQPATQITATSAKLNGKVRPRGLVTTWWFEFGTTKSYGQSTLVGLGLLGDDWASVVQTVSGLQSNTSYHYRVVASNLLGSKQGPDKTFKTAAGSSGSSGNQGGGSSGSGNPGGGSSGNDSGNGNGNSGNGNGNPGDDNGNSGNANGNSGNGGDDSGNGNPGDDNGDHTGSGNGNGSGSSGDDSQPELGKTVGVEPEDGTVRVREPGKSHWDAVDPTVPVPTGTVIDATKGTISLTTALPNGKTQTAKFWGGMFEVRQTRAGGGYTDIHLRGSSLADCPTGGTKSLQASASKKKKRASRLWGSDKHGRYRTHGRNSVATVRGTTWLTTDRCGGTVTWVRDGAVSVRDKHRKRTVLVRAGHAYLARNSH